MLEGTQLRMVVLDACRNSPGWRNKGRRNGLAAASAVGELLVCAAQAGQTATDEGEGTGVCAQQLTSLLLAGVGDREVCGHRAIGGGH